MNGMEVTNFCMGLLKANLAFVGGRPNDFDAMRKENDMVKRKRF